ncbi:hemerythrin domain-containing protein [Nocardioides sp. J9]|uniref:hemerythrin domain-containing protein n=1 Tax=Nocardioides sp. J9 TaxID=935844 RepID=UPI0011A2203B|nr:hemerythrin domain-containing protein [Nocardioides sp. J9]
MTSSTQNVVELLTAQHRQVERLFDEVQTTTDTDRCARAFDELRRLLSVHEAAEEIVTHPNATRHGIGDVVEARHAEEHEAKELLASLDGLDVNSAEFASGIERLRTMVLEHARNEEELEFPTLLAEASEAELEKMAAAVLAVEKIAPTRPHPAAGESAVVNAAVGPLASLVDRARDAARAAMR